MAGRAKKQCLFEDDVRAMLGMPKIEFADEARNVILHHYLPSQLGPEPLSSCMGILELTSLDCGQDTSLEKKFGHGNKPVTAQMQV